MPNCPLTLRTVKGSKLTFNELDGNFLSLQNCINIVENNLNNLVNNTLNNRWHVPYGTTVTVNDGFQSFVYGDLYVEGLIELLGDSQLVVLNGDIILSGGTISGTGVSYVIDIPEYDSYVTGGTYNNSTQAIDFSGNLGFPSFSVDVSTISTNDITVVSGVYDNNTGTATFTNNTGGTFTVTGFLTGYTNYYTTGATLNGTILEFDRTDLTNAYSVDLNPILSAFSTTDYYTTGSTLNGTILEFDRTDLTNAYSVDLSPLKFTGNTSASCITDLYVSNIHSCSPLNINPLNEGNVYFGSANTLTVDVVNNRVGVKNSNPNYTLDVGGPIHLFGPGNTGSIIVEDTQPGGATIALDPQRGTGIPQLVTYNNFPIVLSTNNSERIRINSNGLVGIGTNTPSEKLEVNGKTKTTTLQITSGATNGYVLTSDALGNASWSPQSVTGDTNFANTDLTFSGNRTHNTNNNYLWIQTNGTTSGASIYMDSTNWIDVGFSTSPTLGNFTRWTPTETIHYHNTIPRLTISNSETVINEDGQQYNFRIEGEDDQNLFFVKASTGQDNVGIGTNSPSEKLEVSGKTKTTNFQMTSGATNGYVLTSDALGNATWNPQSVTGDTNFANTDLTFSGNRYHDTDGNILQITTDGGGYNEAWFYMDILGASNLGTWIGWSNSYVRVFNQEIQLSASDGILTNRVNITDTSTVFNGNTVPDVDFNVKTQSDGNSLFVNGTTGRVGIGTNSPSEKLEVSGKTKTTNFQMTSGATNGYVLTSDASGNATWQTPTGGSGLIAPITMSWDGQGGFITTGLTRYFVVPYNCTISGWSIVSEGTNPTCTIDVWKITSGTSLPTNIDTITASAPPNLTTGNVIRSSTLTGWTTSLLAGDILGFNIDATNNALTIKINLELQ